MSSPAFLVDESAFEHAVPPASGIEEGLGAFVGLLEETLAFSARPIGLPEIAYSLVVTSSGETLAALIGIAPDTRERDFLLRLLTVLGRCQLLSTEGPATPTVIQTSGPTYTLNSYAFAKAFDVFHSLAGYAAVLTSRARSIPSGKAILIRNGNPAEVYVVVEPTDLPMVYRSTIDAVGPDEAEFFVLAARAYPKLILHPTLSFRGFQHGYHATRAGVCVHLAFLNDEFLRLANACHWDHVSMMAAAPIPFSDESTATKRNRRLIRMRTITIRGVSVNCTLHTKLRPTTDRIHFHPPVPDLDSERLVVGIFVDHLET